MEYLLEEQDKFLASGLDGVFFHRTPPRSPGFTYRPY
jgi:hypothetical protein